MNPMLSEATATGWRPRFTVRSLFVATTLVAMLCGFWVAGLRVLVVEVAGCVVLLFAGFIAGRRLNRDGKREKFPMLVGVALTVSAVPLVQVARQGEALEAASLIAVLPSLAIGVVLGVDSLEPQPHKRLRRWHKLLIAGLAGSILAGWTALRWSERERELALERYCSELPLTWTWGSAVPVYLGPVPLFHQWMIDINAYSDPVTDRTLKRICQIDRIRRLSLNHTRITDAGLRSIASLTRLELLSLAGTQVGDAGLEHLKGLKNLRQLNLKRTATTAAGVEALRQALPELVIER